MLQAKVMRLSTASQNRLSLVYRMHSLCDRHQREIFRGMTGDGALKKTLLFSFFGRPPRYRSVGAVRATVHMEMWGKGLRGISATPVIDTEEHRHNLETSLNRKRTMSKTEIYG